MAEIIGSLRPDKATYGEKQVLEKLKHSLPSDFTVYVECPLIQPRRRGGRGEMRRYPDFIVLANFGVVVLEVKDWVQIESADKFHAFIRTRDGKTRKVRNPVEEAREFAMLLAEKLEEIPALLRERSRLEVPWGYASILPNLPMSTITQLRSVWGESFVLGMADLEPHVATKRMRGTLPFNRMLRSREMDYVRGVINPSIVIPQPLPGEGYLLLDRDQERIVAEPVVTEDKVAQPQKPPSTDQKALFEVPASKSDAVEAPELAPTLLEDKVVLNTSIRLVRGVAGSGKSLVLIRRAQYLRATYPNWKIGVFTYNDKLASSLNAQLRGHNMHVKTFHKLCASLLKGSLPWRDPVESAQGWINRHKAQWPIVNEFGAEFLSEEIEWIKEVGISDRETYLHVARRGRGAPLSKNRRGPVFDLFEAYQEYLAREGLMDWADIPHQALKAMDAGKAPTGIYDAILIDEAQDFAPVWMRVITRLLKPNSGYLFMADDPSQSIYRFFSWREKGINVMGRTRWLRVP